MLDNVVHQVEQHQLLLNPHLKRKHFRNLLPYKKNSKHLLYDFDPTSGHLVGRLPVLYAPSREALYRLLGVLQVDQDLHELLLLELVILPTAHLYALRYCTSPTFGI